MTAGSIVYYVLEGYIIYLALVGTWRIAQSTIAKGNLMKYDDNMKSEAIYSPARDLSPFVFVAIVKWFFAWKRDLSGQSDLVILKRQFSWGLRFLMLSIVLQYVLNKIQALFF